jgi:hypothetical protein
LLNSSSWSIRDATGALIGQAKDNDIGTGALLHASQAVVRCVIDLGAPSTVHRLYFASADQTLNPGSSDADLTGSRMFGLSLWVSATNSPQGQALVTYEARSVTGHEIRVNANLRFQPTTGRFLILELNRDAISNRWNLGEVEVYGWAGDQRASLRDAVSLAAGAPAPLQLAAKELSYYLGELSGHPVPTVTPDQATAYTGTIFRVMDLKSLAQSYEQMTNNMTLGLIPTTPVNVEREGREIQFKAWPYRNVLWSVWEFLERQGIRWVYPDAHGDRVPTGQGINLDVAPLHLTPSSDFIYANFGVEYLRDDPDAFLHFWRNRWTHTWGGHQRDIFDGSEVPVQPRPAYTPAPDYVEGFEGYPHNFRNVLPDRILAQHMDWCGLLTNQQWASWLGAENLGRRMLPSQNWTTFDLSNAEARQFIINKAIASWNGHVRSVGNIYWMLPEDGMLFSEDSESLRLRGPLRGDKEPFAFPYPHVVSGDYYDFIAHVAEGIRTALPEAKVGAMAYSNTHLPPDRTSPFPSNVLVEVCMYGARNLPMSSPKNAEMRQRLERWSELATELRHYDYDLIHREAGALPMPVPLVSAMSDRAQFFAAHHMLAGGTQADLESLPYNPWNYYAYPRFYWDTATSPTLILNDFFSGYYAESATPMLNYYSTMERYLIANNVSLQGRGYDYGLRVAAYPVNVLKRMHQCLLQAEGLATYWVTRQRVQSARAGFNWILEQRELTLQDLASVDAFPRVGPGRTVTLDLRFAQIQTAGQDVGDAWYLFSWAEVGDYVYFEKPGRYEITIQAGIGWEDPEIRNREMLFRIGSLEYGPYPIDHANVETYTLIVEAPAGVMVVAVEDLHNDGPFKVSTITIAGATATPQTKMVLANGTHLFDYAVDGNPAEFIDSDWDGNSDLHEMLSGTDELDPESFFAAVYFEPIATGLCLKWPSVSGKRYALYRSTSLNGTFKVVASELPATPPENMYVDNSSAQDAGFYQISVQ